MQSLPLGIYHPVIENLRNQPLKCSDWKTSSHSDIFTRPTQSCLSWEGLKKNSCERPGRVHKEKKGKCYFRLMLNGNWARCRTVSQGKAFIYVSFGHFFSSPGLMYNFSLGLWFTVSWRKKPGMTKAVATILMYRPRSGAFWQLHRGFQQAGQGEPTGKADTLKPHKIKSFPLLIWNTQFAWVLEVMAAIFSPLKNLLLSEFHQLRK